MSRRLTFRDLHEMAVGRPCMWCGLEMKKVNIHHINHDRTDDRIKNFSLICQECHVIHHAENGRKMTGKYKETEVSSLPETFHESLKYFRKSRRMSIVILAENIGVAASTISRWERGIVRTPIEGINALARALRINISTLVEGRKAS